MNSSQAEDVRTRASGIIAMGKAGDRNAIKSLVAILENTEEIDWLRGCAAIALGRLSGEEVIDPLLNALEDESMVVARAVISALGDVRSRRTVPFLKKMMEDSEKEELHAAAIAVLGETGGSEIVPTLVAALKSPNNRVRVRAVMALGELRIEKAVVPLIGLLKDSDELLRAAAASSLGLIGDKRAAETLIKALSDPAESVRAIAASSLGCLGESRAVPALEEAMDDESITVRRQAAAALSKIRAKIEL